jgi:hypothetical protein
MDNKRQLDNDEIIPSSPQVQISKKSRTLKEVNHQEIKNNENFFEDFFNDDDDFELKENLFTMSGNMKVQSSYLQ